MDYHFLTLFVYIIIIIGMTLLVWNLIKKVDTQTNTLLDILKSFSDIESDLQIVTTKLEDYEEFNGNRDSTLRETISSTIKTLAERIEKLEKTSNSKLEKLDRDINRLYAHCSRKLDREETNSE